MTVQALMHKLKIAGGWRNKHVAALRLRLE